MRPIDDAFACRSRSTSFTDNTPTPGQHQPPQMSYFLTDEKSMDASLSHSSSSSPRRSREAMKRGNYGVESLDTTISSLNQDSDDQDTKVSRARNNWKKNLAKDMSRKDEDTITHSRSPSPCSSVIPSGERSPSEPRSRRSQHNIHSQPLTPLSLESPIIGPIASSPSSRRNSETDFFTDEVGSQAIQSSGEEEKETLSEAIDSSASQLVMPSIMMPSRRPFTDKGKSMGRLKVMIAGDSGIGKTSLIKAIVQLCDDIVHVDPLSTNSMSASEITRRKSKSKGRKSIGDLNTTKQITEVYASTRAYPQWWSELDDLKFLRRRKSSGDSVLERNLCFVDTPGYGNGTSCMECITPVLQYVESHLMMSSSTSGISDNNLLNMLSGNGGSQVDVVLYVILHRIKAVDLEYMRRLSPLTNVIPVIAQSESLSTEQLRSLKANILSQLQEANIRPFLFGFSPEEVLSSSQPLPPFSISTMTTTDDENMDASLLMSPDYVAPLFPTELSPLVSLIFAPNTISWLRHSAAKKAIQYHKNGALPSISLPRPLTTQNSILTAPIGATNSYALARITDHTQREEHLAQVRLSKWATDLQRSLQNERARFEALARGERAIWLTERLNECVQDGTLVATDNCSTDHAASSLPGMGRSIVKQETYSRRGRNQAAGVSLNCQDPLGLLQLSGEMRQKSWTAVKIVSGFGIVGGLAIWLAGRWHSESGMGWAYSWGWADLATDW